MPEQQLVTLHQEELHVCLYQVSEEWIVCVCVCVLIPVIEHMILLDTTHYAKSYLTSMFSIEELRWLIG